MKYDVKKKCNQCGCSLKRYVFAALAVLVIVLLMLAGNYFNSECSESKPVEPQKEEMQTEPLPIPEEIKEQGEPEITKLNPNPEIKEGW